MNLKNTLSTWPAWIMSVLTLMAILWLTLAPKPLGENPPPLFPGVDKLAHALMFGFFGVIMDLDWQRKHSWLSIRMPMVLGFATLSGLLGIGIEFAQANMNLGRGFEYEDMIADIVGAYGFGILWIILQKFWVTKNK